MNSAEKKALMKILPVQTQRMEGLRMQASISSSSRPARRLRLVAADTGTVTPVRIIIAAVLMLKALQKNLFLTNLNTKYQQEENSCVCTDL